MSQLTARFQNIYNIDKVHFLIVGCGAIGSYTAMALARAGGKTFSIYDNDVVATVNIGVQHFNTSHIGKSKVNMLARQMTEVNPAIRIKKVPNRYEPDMTWSRSWLSIPSQVDTQILIIGVDSMNARSKVMEKYCDKIFKHWEYGIPGNGEDDHYRSGNYRNIYVIDARMGSETFQSNIFHFNPELRDRGEGIEGYEDHDWTHDMHREEGQRYRDDLKDRVEEFKSEYMETWYPDEDGDNEPCNARSTGYCASMAAAFINNQVRKIVDETSLVNPEITFNFPSMTLLSTMDKSRLTT